MSDWGGGFETTLTRKGADLGDPRAAESREGTGRLLHRTACLGLAEKATCLPPVFIRMLCLSLSFPKS